ncbi:MAG TPA: hypothetical protein VFV64_05355 [Permianibacter sp.]|nr:hypothetical protein [Permianibacter sp.]
MSSKSTTKATLGVAICLSAVWLIYFALGHQNFLGEKSSDPDTSNYAGSQAYKKMNPSVVEERATSGSEESSSTLPSQMDIASGDDTQSPAEEKQKARPRARRAYPAFEPSKEFFLNDEPDSDGTGADIEVEIYTRFPAGKYPQVFSSLTVECKKKSCFISFIASSVEERRAAFDEISEIIHYNNLDIPLIGASFEWVGDTRVDMYFERGLGN